MNADMSEKDLTDIKSADKQSADRSLSLIA